MVQLIWYCPLLTLCPLGMTGNWICIDLSGTNYDANASAFVKYQVMWVICPGIFSFCVCVYVDGDNCRQWSCVRVGFYVDVTYYSLCKGCNTRKRVLFRVKHECAFPEWSSCAWCRTEWLCRQKNNADPFTLLSYRETTSNKERKSVDSASPTTFPHKANNWDDCEKRALWKWA